MSYTQIIGSLRGFSVELNPTLIKLLFQSNPRQTDNYAEQNNKLVW